MTEKYTFLPLFNALNNITAAAEPRESYASRALRALSAKLDLSFKKARYCLRQYSQYISDMNRGGSAARVHTSSTPHHVMICSKKM